MANNKVSTETPSELNARVNLWSYNENGEKYVNFEADKEAARNYFLQTVNPKTQHFYTLHEKLEFLFDNEYYEPHIWEQYGLKRDEADEIILDEGFEAVKSLYQFVYSFKHRFEAYFSANKFYVQYAMKTFDKSTWLERFEDRVVANALLLGRGDMDAARLIAEEIVTGRIQPATPTFSNAGKAQRGEYVSCFLVRVEDNMESISRMHNAALQLSKRGGGVALNLTNIREMGSPIKKIKGQSSGIIPVMKMLEDAFSYANQLGTRSGAGAVYLNAHHPDIMRFLDTKRENADEKVRIKTLSLGVVIPDITFELARGDKDMYLFSPYDVERVYGIPMSDLSITEHYYDMVDNPEITKTKIKAREFFTANAEVQFESGYPYTMYEDTVNAANPIEGRINMSNLCVTGDTEILTDSGYRTVKSLHESQEDFGVVVDVRARDMDGSSYGISVEKSTKMFKTAEDADVYEIKTVEGFSIKATEWHKFYILRGKEVVKLPLADLEIGDKLLVQSEEGEFGSVNSPDLAYLAGTLAADGTFGATRNGSDVARWDLYDDKEEFKDAIEKSAHSVLSGREDLLHRDNATTTPSFNYSSNSSRWSMSSAPLTALLADLGVSNGTKLVVPDFVKLGDKETQSSYLSGVYQMDGSVTGSISIKSCSIELGSVELQFLKSIQQLLLNFGAYSRIYKSREAGTSILPDGKGGMAEYPMQELWSLRVSESQSRIVLFDIVDWREAHILRWKALGGGRITRTKARFHKFTATVKSIEFSGVEDVYDVTVANGNSVIFNGIATGNCTEILQVNTPSTYNDDLSYKTLGNDISCNLASMNIAKAMIGGNLGKTVNAAVRGLSAVSDLSDIQSVPSIAKGNRASRAIGLGQMNLHGFFLKEGWDYGDENSLDFTNIYFMTVAYHAYKASMELAKETGSPFENFENSEYANVEYLSEKYSDPALTVPSPNTKNIFEKYGIEIPSSVQWSQLAENIVVHGLYNAYLQAVPPTGSISYVNYATSSIHPVAAAVEARKEGLTGRVYFPQPYVTNENFSKVQDAFQVGYEKTIDVYAAATKHVDQGLSMTLFFPDTATTRDINKAQIMAWRKGIKTIYYSRIRQQALAGTESEECVGCML